MLHLNEFNEGILNSSLVLHASPHNSHPHPWWHRFLLVPWNHSCRIQSSYLCSLHDSLCSIAEMTQDQMVPTHKTASVEGRPPLYSVDLSRELVCRSLHLPTLQRQTLSPGLEELPTCQPNTSVPGSPKFSHDRIFQLDLETYSGYMASISHQQSVSTELRCRLEV